MAKLWGGRFTGATDPLMHAFNQSLSYDKRMYRADIIGSQAYAKGLVQAGVLTEDERKVSRYRKILDAMADVQWSCLMMTVYARSSSMTA